MQRNGTYTGNVVQLIQRGKVHPLGSKCAGFGQNEAANTARQTSHAPEAARLSIVGPHVGVTRHAWMVSVVDDLIDYCDVNGLRSTSTLMQFLKADMACEVLRKEPHGG